jgi:hypothetical protein
MTAVPANQIRHVQVVTPGQCREGSVRARLQRLKTGTFRIREETLTENTVIFSSFRKSSRLFLSNLMHSMMFITNSNSHD